MDEVGAEVRGRQNVIERSHFKGSMHAMYAVKLGGELAQLLGVYEFEEFVPLDAQAPFLHAVSFGHRLAQHLQALVLTSPGIDFARKNDRRRRRASDDRGVRSLKGRDFQTFVQGARENHISAPVIAGDHAEYHGAFEVDYGSPDLGPVLKLQLAHRLR